MFSPVPTVLMQVTVEVPGNDPIVAPLNQLVEARKRAQGILEPWTSAQLDDVTLTVSLHSIDTS